MTHSETVAHPEVDSDRNSLEETWEIVLSNLLIAAMFASIIFTSKQNFVCVCDSQIDSPSHPAAACLESEYCWCHSRNVTSIPCCTQFATSLSLIVSGPKKLAASVGFPHKMIFHFDKSVFQHQMQHLSPSNRAEELEWQPTKKSGNLPLSFAHTGGGC